MSWLRIDDGFASHRKIAALTDREFRVWLRVLCYCAQSRRGTVDKVTIQEVVGLTRNLAERYADLELLDRAEGTDFVVHDWAKFNPKDPTSADRIRRFRENNPEVKKGQWEEARAAVFERDQGICLDCGEFNESWHADHDPNRKTLADLGLSIYDLDYIRTLCPSCHAKKTRRDATERRANEQPNETPNVEPDDNGPSRAGTGARSRPVPSPSSSPAAASIQDQAAAALHRYDFTQAVVDRALAEPARALAWIDLAEREASRNPGGFVRKGIEGGTWPSERRNGKPDEKPREYLPCPDPACRALGFRSQADLDDHRAATHDWVRA